MTPRMTCTLTYPHSHELTATSPDGKKTWTIWANYADGKALVWVAPYASEWKLTDHCLVNAS